MKILCIQLRRLGDILLCTPAVQYLKELFPQAEIDFLSEPMGRLVLEGNPHIKNLILYDKKRPLGEILSVRARRYDLVVDFMGNPRSAVLTGLSGARWRSGYDHRGRKFFYNSLLKRQGKKKYGARWKIDLVDEWLRASGQTPRKASRVRPRIYPDQEDRDFAAQWLTETGSEEKPLVILAPIHRHPIRQWRLDGFRETALQLADKGASVFLAWGPGEESMVEKVRSGAKEKIGLLPKTTFRQMAAIMEKAKVVVTNDSGSMHTAVAVDCPTVTIYGPTRPEDWNPSFEDDQGRDIIVQANDVACLGCHLSECPVGHLCMGNLTSTPVLRAAEKFLNLN